MTTIIITTLYRVVGVKVRPVSTVPVSVSNLILIDSNEGNGDDVLDQDAEDHNEVDCEDDPEVDAHRLNAPDHHIWIGQTPKTETSTFLNQSSLTIHPI